MTTGKMEPSLVGLLRGLVAGLPREWALAFAFVAAGFAFSTAWAATPSALRGDPAVRENQTRLESGLVESLRAQIARRMAQPESVFDLQIDSLRLEPALAPQLRVLGVQVLGLGSSGSKRLDGLFHLSVLVTTDQGPLERAAVGVLRVVGPTWVAKTALKRGQVVTEADVQLMTLPWSRLPNGAAATGLNQILGQRVTQGITGGDVIYGGVLDAPLDVRSGDLVELTVLSGPGVIIRSRGKAQQEGRKGDLVRILQPDTKKSLTGVIVGERAVEIRL